MNKQAQNDDTSASENAEKLDYSYITGGKVKCCHSKKEHRHSLQN